MFYIICGGCAVLSVLICLESVFLGIVKPRVLLQRLRPDSAVQILMLLYLAFTLVSSLLSKHPTVWVGSYRNDGFLTVLIYVLCFYFTAKFIKPQKWMMYLFGGAVTLMCLLSIVQTVLNPQGAATREQVATMLMRFCNAYDIK